MYELTVTTTFSSAHNIRGYEGACERLHGHNWRVEVFVCAEELDRLGMAMDFKRLKAETRSVIDGLDHCYLNETPPFDVENATAENIARFIYKKLSDALKGSNVRVSRVRVWESDSAAASYSE